MRHTRTGILSTLLLLAAAVLSSEAAAAPGDLDLSFGTNGIVRIESGAWGSRFYSWGGTAAQDPAHADALVLTAIAVTPSSHTAITTAEIAADGSLLQSSGLGFAADAGVLSRIALDPTDTAAHRLYAVGSTSPHATLLVARLSASGDALDPSFGGGAPVSTDIPGTTQSAATALAVQSDGKLLVAGGAGDFFADLALARYDAAGNLDPSFGSGGTLVLAGAGFANAIALQDDGRIVVAGVLHHDAITAFGVLRLLADGSVDSSFGSAGMTTVGFTARFTAAAPAGVKILADGRIVAGGSNLDQNTSRGSFVAARFRADGTLDPTFGARGKVLKRVGKSNAAGAVAFQRDGKIVLVGSGRVGRGVVHTEIALLRLTADGKPDRSFGRRGKVETPVVATNGVEGFRVNDAALDSLGHLTVIGATADGSGKGTVLARYGL